MKEPRKILPEVHKKHMKPLTYCYHKRKDVSEVERPLRMRTHAPLEATVRTGGTSVDATRI